jgi:diguanylate cyclase (GGDEF)-like protein
MRAVDDTLLTVIVVLGLTSAASWAMAGAGWRLAPQASYRFAVANVCIALGVALVVQRTDAPNFWYFQFSDWLVLGGLVVFRGGIQRMLRVGHAPWYWQAIPLVVAVLATAWVEPSLSSSFVLGLAFSAVAAWVALDATRWCFAGLSAAGFSRRIAALISAPFIFVGVTMVLRLVQIGLDYQVPQMPATNAAGEASFSTFLWVMLFLMLVINLTLGALLVIRLLLRIRKLAERDHLTGCWNRGSLEARLQVEYDRNRRSGEHLSCVFLDVDHFKKVNDGRGHQAGDAALLHTAKLLVEQLREMDTVGRYGGEEFVVLLPGTHLTGAREVAEKLRKALEANPVRFKDDTFSITASFGVASLTGNESQEGFLQRADAAMYQAKQSGRNRVETAP